MVNHRCIYTHTPARMHARMHTCTYAKPSLKHAHTHMHTHTHTCAPSHTQAPTRASAPANAHTRSPANAHTRAPNSARTCRRTLTHAHAHPHIRALSYARLCKFSPHARTHTHIRTHIGNGRICVQISMVHCHLVLHEYSRFPDVEIVKSFSAQTVIPIVDKVFSSRGIPESLKTDNGSPFQSSEFRNFANDLGFQHQRITLHSLANMWSLRGL